MERFDISPDQTFNVPRRYSQDRNIRLAEIARSLVRDGTLDSLDGARERREPGHAQGRVQRCVLPDF